MFLERNRALVRAGSFAELQLAVFGLPPQFVYIVDNGFYNFNILIAIYLTIGFCDSGRDERQRENAEDNMQKPHRKHILKK